MEELSNEQKVAWLREIQKWQLPYSHFCKRQEAYNMEGLIEEGLLDAEFSEFADTGLPDRDVGFFTIIRVTQKGIEFIADFEAETTWRGIWKKYHLKILVWALGTVFTAWLIAYLLKIWGQK